MMYACGHDQNGERNFEYENLLPYQRMTMSSGQCPKCVELRNRHQIPDLYDGFAFKLGNTPSPKIIGPDPEILAIMRLFLEKYEILASGDREMYSKALSAFMNPPMLAFNENKGEK